MKIRASSVLFWTLWALNYSSTSGFQNSTDPPTVSADPTGSPVMTPTASPSSPPSLACGVTTISIVQKRFRAYENKRVRICSGYVTAVVYDGFFIQEDVLPQSGIFVFTFDPPDYLELGHSVIVEGALTRYERMTQLAQSVSVAVNVDVERKFFDHVPLILPAERIRDLRLYESMLVEVAAPEGSSLVVSDYDDLDRFGEIVVCAASNDDGRPYHFTSRHAPNVTSYESHVNGLLLGCLTLDDNDKRPSPDPILVGGVHAVSRESIVRGGSEVTTLRGPLYINTNYGPYYRVATATEDDLTFDRLPRESSPDLPVADVRIAYANLYNYFTTFGDRGADNFVEFTRQATKVATALSKTNADVFGLVDLENTGKTVLDLVTRLNKDSLNVNDRDYKAASLEAVIPQMGNDAVRCDVLFDVNRLEMVGSVAVLDDEGVDATVLERSSIGTLFGSGGSHSPVAVSLKAKASGNVFTVVVNHYRGRTNPGNQAQGGDANQRDGSSTYNLLRTLTSEATVAWLKTNPTGVETDNIILIGDFNAYPMETPITYLLENGYSSAIDFFASPPPYTYLFNGQFGTVDHVLLSDESEALRGAAIWHVNADEPDLIDYNLYVNRDVELFDGNSPERFADHDVLIAALFDEYRPPPTAAPTTADLTAGNDNDNDKAGGNAGDKDADGGGSTDTSTSSAGDTSFRAASVLTTAIVAVVCSATM